VDDAGGDPKPVSLWSAFHWHPVHSTYQMALMTALSDAHIVGYYAPEQRLAAQQHEEGRGLAASALPLALIHPRAWNRYSANFATTEFSEVGLLFVLIHRGFIAHR
jgi:hypothetical protein